VQQLGMSIRLFLVDGNPSGIVSGEVGNWTGKLIATPRTRIADVVRREELQRTGIYVLSGPDPDDPTRSTIYVGETDSLAGRMKDHDAKDFWNRVCMVFSKDTNLTKAHARYLESRLIAMANAAGVAAVLNGTAPPRPPLPDADISDMEQFLQNLKVALPVMGYGFFESRAAKATSEEEAATSPVFVLPNTLGLIAHAREIDGALVVLAESTARQDGTPSWTSFRVLRDKLLMDGKLVPTEDPGILRFATNVEFASPSAAAAVVMARNQNGRVTWKIENTNITYADWQDGNAEAGPSH
jgi:hypothetical protein